LVSGQPLTAFEQRAEKLLRRVFVAEALHQDVENRIVLISYASEWWETML
jgi:hypothetical protein